MPFVDPDRIEQSDRVQAASFAPSALGHHVHGRRRLRHIDALLTKCQDVGERGDLRLKLTSTR